MVRSAAVFALAALSVAAAARDEEIPLDKAPAAAVKAMKQKYPNAQVTKVEKEDDDGKTVIEFTLKDGTRKLEAEFTPEGKFVKEEAEVGEKDVPQAVMAAFRQKYPAAAPTKMEKVTRGEGAEAKVVYEFDITDGGKECEVYFSPDGTFVEKKDAKPADGSKAGKKGDKPEKK